MDLLNELNESQREAVTSTEGYIRVIAGAGSGKTRALTHRYAYLVNELGILPENILCVTFTNKAANEMRQRIHSLTGDNDTGYISTFHGFCVAVLQEDSYLVEYPKSFLVLDNSDINDMLKMIYDERGLSMHDMTFSAARNMIEMEKLVNQPDYYMNMIDLSLDKLYEKYTQAVIPKDIIFYGYLYQEKKMFGLDYNDLIKFTLHIFKHHEACRQKWQERMEYIMIDEFQDIDPPQYELMKVLAGYHKNLFVVGDPDQTIYTWRGANIRFLLDFPAEFKGTKTIMLMENYRSTPEILAAANKLISTNKNRIKKDLVAKRAGLQKPTCYFATNDAEEAKWVAQQIQGLIASGLYKHKDITILYRAHYVSRSLEETFLKEKIPYRVYSGVQFFERREIKDTLSYLRMVLYQDDLSFRRVCNVPKRNIGEKRMHFLETHAANEGLSLYQAMKKYIDDPIFRGTKAREFMDVIDHYHTDYTSYPVSDLFSYVANDSGYEEALRTEGSQERLDNLAELKQSIHEYEVSCGEEAGLEDYLKHVALFTNADIEDTEDQVKMMTVHAAKGLEFPVVFMVSMNEGIFPSRKTKTAAGMEEERRLAFVAATRAEDLLFLSEADGRNFDSSPRYPSRFLINMGFENLNFIEVPRESLIKMATAYISSQEKFMAGQDMGDLLPSGSRVKHAVFGAGTILSHSEDGKSYMIQFDNMKTPRKVVARIFTKDNLI